MTDTPVVPVFTSYIAVSVPAPPTWPVGVKTGPVIRPTEALS